MKVLPLWFESGAYGLVYALFFCARRFFLFGFFFEKIELGDGLFWGFF